MSISFDLFINDTIIIPLIHMVEVVVLIEQYLKEAINKISTAICTCSSNPLIHPNFYSTIFSSLFQDQVTFLPVRIKIPLVIILQPNHSKEF